MTRRVPTPDGPVAVLDAGDGPAVLFVPGYTGTKEDFAPLLPLLAAAGLRAVAMDLPGQYETPGPDDRPPTPRTRCPARCWRSPPGWTGRTWSATRSAGWSAGPR